MHLYFSMNYSFWTYVLCLALCPSTRWNVSLTKKKDEVTPGHAHMQSQIGLWEPTVAIVHNFNCFFFFERKENKRKNDICVRKQMIMFVNLLSEIVILFKAEFLIYFPLTCYESKNNQFPIPLITHDVCRLYFSYSSEIGACFIFSHIFQLQSDF